MPLLEVHNLSVQLPTSRGLAFAVRDLSFTLEAGQTLGLIGESGCGKSLTALALMGLLPEQAQVSGRIVFNGHNLLDLSDNGMRQLRGNRLGMVFQEPMTALNPVHRIGAQVAEPLRLHTPLNAKAIRQHTIALLERVGIADAARRVDAYPHQFSGGQRQRITIAMALACNPDLLIADEPTTALDVTVQGQILDLIDDLVKERGMALILISHDLGVIAQNVQNMMVMYGGALMEYGPTATVFEEMAHPYTRGLFAARPQLGSSGGSGAGAGSGSGRYNAQHGARLATIAGSVPELADLPAGCPFASRCHLAQAQCTAIRPQAEAISPGHTASCLRLDVSRSVAPEVAS